MTETCVRSVLAGWAGWWAEIGTLGPMFLIVGLARVDIVGSWRGPAFVVGGAGMDP